MLRGPLCLRAAGLGTALNNQKTDSSMSEVEERVAAVEARLEQTFAIDARFKSLEGEVRKLKGGTGLRDWVQTLGPYVSGLVVLLVGFWIKDSVTLALQREQLDLEYVKQMRDLIKDFDQAPNQAEADADAVGLAMYGQHAIIPLVERLEGGDVASLAAERGLGLIGSNDPAVACPKFAGVVADRARRFKWQTHKTMIKVIGRSACVQTAAMLQEYRGELQALGSDATKATAFARRYSETESFDIDSAANLGSEIDATLAILNMQAKP